MSNLFPPTTSQIPNKPQIKLCLTGLGVLCLSNDHNRAEIGYLDIEGHDALISMRDSSGNYLIEMNTSMRDKNLEILSANKGIGEVYAADGDPKNFDKMLDLSEIYATASELRSDSKFQARIFIEDAVFYTEDSSLMMVRPYDFNNPSSKLPEREVGTKLSAVTKPSNLVVRFDNTEIPLQADETYYIRILSNCRGTGVSDFYHFYDFLDNPGAIQYNLEEATSQTVPLTPDEQEEYRLLTNRFGEVLDSESSPGDSDDLQNAREHLRNLRCPPVPCLKATFATQPRSLP